MPFRKQNGDGRNVFDWGKIGEGLIIALVMAVLSGAISWIAGIGDLKNSAREMRKDLRSVSSQTTVIGQYVWNHLHPGEPCPWPDQMKRTHDKEDTH